MKSKLLATALLALFLGACASTDIPDPDPSDTTLDGSDGSGADTEGWDEEGLGDLEPVETKQAVNLIGIKSGGIDNPTGVNRFIIACKPCSRSLPGSARRWCNPVPSQKQCRYDSSGI